MPPDRRQAKEDELQTEEDDDACVNENAVASISGLHSSGRSPGGAVVQGGVFCVSFTGMGMESRKEVY